MRSTFFCLYLRAAIVFRCRRRTLSAWGVAISESRPSELGEGRWDGGAPEGTVVRTDMSSGGGWLGLLELELSLDPKVGSSWTERKASGNVSKRFGGGVSMNGNG